MQRRQYRCSSRGGHGPGPRNRLHVLHGAAMNTRSSSDRYRADMVRTGTTTRAGTASAGSTRQRPYGRSTSGRLCAGASEFECPVASAEHTVCGPGMNSVGATPKRLTTQPLILARLRPTATSIARFTAGCNGRHICRLAPRPIAVRLRSSLNGSERPQPFTPLASKVATVRWDSRPVMLRSEVALMNDRDQEDLRGMPSGLRTVSQDAAVLFDSLRRQAARPPPSESDSGKVPPRQRKLQRRKSNRFKC